MVAALMLVAGTAAKAQNADEIMEKHAKAIGGVENWNKIKTLKMVGSMSIQGMDISMTQTTEIGKASRTDISAMGMNGFTIITNKTGWMYMPMQGGTKIDTMKPDMVRAGQRQLDVKGNQMLDYKTAGNKIEYIGKDTVNNAPCYKIKVTDKDGNESTSFFDVATYYLVRTESKMKQDDQEMEIAVAYSDYKKLEDGIVMPMSMTAQGAEIVFKSIEINKPVGKDVFMPKISK
jgi:hypothetical protein